MPFTKGHKINIGKHWKCSPEARKNMGLYNLGKKHSEETKRKMSKSNMGKHSIPRSKEWKKRISKSLGGRKLSENHKINIGKSMLGEKSHFWKGGIAYLPYSFNWTESFKRGIRQRDRYTCQVCGYEPSVIVHHIDYEKQNCDPKNLITLCRICHGKTNKNRDYWTKFFQDIIEKYA